MRCFCWQIQQFCRTVFPCHRNNHLRYFANTCKGFLRWHVLLTILLQRPKKREERYFFALNDDTDLCWDVVRERSKVELCGIVDTYFPYPWALERKNSTKEFILRHRHICVMCIREKSGLNSKYHMLAS